jgi:hypothetical protein
MLDGNGRSPLLCKYAIILKIIKKGGTNFPPQVYGPKKELGLGHWGEVTGCAQP